MNTRILVVDDEPLARERLIALVAELGAGIVVAEAGSGLEALAAVRDIDADVVLLDIRMPEMDGLETARHLAQFEPAPAVIFTTAFDDHALAAFDAQAIDYLLKPIRKDRLQTALARASQFGSKLDAVAHELGGEASRTHLSAVIGGNIRVVPLAEVRFLQADHKYVTVGWPGDQLVVEDSLRSLEEEFGDQFMRIHRNALVAPAYLQSLEKDAQGRWFVTFTDMPERLLVSRRLLSAVRSALR